MLPVVFVLVVHHVIASPIVSTKLGKLKGIVVKPAKADGFTCSAFLGIPFGQSPEFQNRFKPPVPVEPWPDVRDATKYAPSCIQMPNKENEWTQPDESEDCLYLNVITDRHFSENSKKPVIVFIHGGAFLKGSARALVPEDICKSFVSKDVVFVTIQYRLGYLGFLSSGNHRAAGNWGLHDQIAALKWVHHHIENFGGDRNKVTIMGHSAGGASVSLLTLIPAAQPYFAQAIAQSGSAFAYWVVNDKAVESFHKLAESKTTNCGDRSSATESRLKCLRNLPVKLLQKAEWETFGSMFSLKPKRPGVNYGKGGGVGLLELFAVEWAPTFDKDLLNGTLEELVFQAPVKPFLLGTAEKEMVHKIRPLHKLSGQGSKDAIPYSVPDVEQFEIKSLTDTLAAVVRIFQNPHDYRSPLHSIPSGYELGEIKMFEGKLKTEGDIQNKTYLVWQLVELVSHAFAHFPALKEAELKKRHGCPVWLYNYDYPLLGQYDDKKDPFVAAHHADDWFLMFEQNNPARKFELSKQDLRMKDLMITWWTNFAKYGKPTLEKEGENLFRVHWPQYESTEKPTNLRISLHPEIDQKFHGESLEIQVEEEHYDGNEEQHEEL